MLFLSFPNQPQYLFVYLTPSVKNGYVMGILSLNEFFQAFHAAFTTYFFVYTNLCFERNVVRWLQSLSNDKDYSRSSFLAYRSLQYLKALHSKAYRMSVIPIFYIALMFLMIFSFYATVRSYTIMTFPGNLVSPVTFIVISVFCVLLHHSSGSVHEFSKKFIQLRRICMSRGGQMETKSLYALKVHVGGTYYVRK
ncbi:unnamed protein product, partial [Allacma fusca]